MTQKIIKNALHFLLLLITIICLPLLAKSQNFDDYLGKTKSEVINILSGNGNLIFKGVNQSKDGVQFLHYIYKEKDDFSEAFFFNSESICFIVKHVYPTRLYIESVQTFNNNNNLELKSNDFWVDYRKKLTYAIRMIPGTKSFAIEVAKF